MIDKTQYIETLIRLIELNKDPSWINAFRNLRNGGALPGGGAGSLNDWGPTYTDKFQDTWYTNFYRIMRFLFDNHLTPDTLNDFKRIANNDKIRILRCVECNGRYQHPSVFESHIAVHFYKEKILEFYNSKRLIDILNPSESFEDPAVKLYRDWLKSEYGRLNIKIYNFIEAKYVCPHCGKKDARPSDHDLYRIKKSLFGKKKLKHKKNNASWADFES